MYSREFEVSKELLNIENGFCVDFGETNIDMFLYNLIQILNTFK